MYYRYWSALSCGLVFGACVDPAALPVDLKSRLSDELVIFAVLSTDTALHHSIVVHSVDERVSGLPDVTVEVERGTLDSSNEWSWALVAAWDSARAAAAGRPLEDIEHCYTHTRIRIGSQVEYCFTPEVSLELGATYRVRATARGFRPVTGTTRVVGQFAVTKAVLANEEDGHSLSATWTASPFAHRYMMGIRRRIFNCFGCRNGWSIDMDSTRYDGMVPAHVPAEDLVPDFDAGIFPTLVVMAVDKEFYTFLTTGHSGHLFAVFPESSVEGGYGFVGSATFAHMVFDLRTPNGSRHAPSLQGFRAQVRPRF